jgi:type I restriction enzyme, S subunit
MNSDSAQLPPGWEWRNQDEVFSFTGGAQPPASTFVSEPLPGYVRLVQIRDYASDSNLTYVPDSPRLRKCDAKDVMIARYGSGSRDATSDSLGRICRGIAGAYNVALVKASALTGVSSAFLFYLLQSDYFQAPLRGQAGRSVQAGFNKEGLRSIRLPLPPLKEQERIAGVLGTLDDKIAHTKRCNRNLARIADLEFRRLTSHRDLPRRPFSVRTRTAGQASPTPSSARLFPRRDLRVWP